MRGLIFDVGGVLIQLGEPAAAKRRWAKRLRMGVDELDAVTWDAIGPGAPRLRSDVEIYERLGGAVGISDWDAARLVIDFHEHWRPEPRLLAFVDRVRPEVRTAILSNAGPAARFAMTRMAGLDRHFDVLVISNEEGLEKPDPMIYELAAERLGLAPGECVFVDDRTENVEAAERTGMTGVHHIAVVTTVVRLTSLFGLDERSTVEVTNADIADLEAAEDAEKYGGKIP